MFHWRARRPFHIEIRSIEEFALLCALIHGSALPHGRIHDLIDKLHKASAELRQAEAAQRPPQ
jgi:hypothetical protein